MKEYAESLAKYRQLVGEPKNRATINETETNFIIRHDLSKADLEGISHSELADFLTLFGDSLTCIVSQMVGNVSTGNIPVTPQVRTEGFPELAEFPHGTQFRMRVTIDKQKLLLSVFGYTPGTMLFYFDSTAIQTTLNQSLLTIENSWFKAGEKVFLMVGDEDCTLVGDVLHVFGRVYVDTIRGFIQPSLPALTEKLQTRLTTRASETHWQDATRFLLPEHLKVVDRTTDGDTVFKPRLNRLLLDLTIAGLANYTHSEASNLVWLFEGQKRLEIGPNATAPVSDAVCSSWFDIYDWTYENHTRDKLSIVRNLLTLQPYTPQDQNYGVLSANGDILVRSAKDHYDKFIGESIKTYFDKLKEATTYVQAKVDSVSQQVNGLVDTFTKNLLAVAGFIIGTVLVKLIDPNLSRIYPLIVIGFAFYLGIILIVYYPLAFWSYVLTVKEYNHSLDLYGRSFTDEDVKTFIGTSFKRRKVHFWIAFIVTALVQILLLVAAYIARRHGWPA